MVTSGPELCCHYLPGAFLDLEMEMAVLTPQGQWKGSSHPLHLEAAPDSWPGADHREAPAGGTSGPVPTASSRETYYVLAVLSKGRFDEHGAQGETQVVLRVTHAEFPAGEAGLENTRERLTGSPSSSLSVPFGGGTSRNFRETEFPCPRELILGHSLPFSSAGPLYLALCKL